ncbi:MAG: diaminopropionate ammonia-lyase [Acidobacteria bacterium]|nr:diaminopropionate ammonia-lyase [Acidobacteriota bacterium]
MTSTYVTARPTLLPAASAPGLFSRDEYALVARFFERHPELAPTPLAPLPGLARRLGLGTLLAKDETHRFGLNAFKLLGARFAVEQLLAEGAIRPGDTLVCASEGNHGRAVAHTARALGCSARVYLSESVAAPRADAIAGEGATVVRVAGTYDDAVRQAAADAEAQQWTVVSDTSWPGYERIPRLIMLGYTRMMDEMIQGMPDDWRPDAIFVPGGVGGLLAAVASWSAFHFPRPPHIVAVEPSSCACLQVSARAGTPTTVPGPFTTMMGGLRCGEVSPLAFDGVLPIVDGYIAVDDAWAERAMRLLGRPADLDPAIEAGPSGAAALAGLLATREDPAARELALYLDLGSWSTVVVIVSEGMTDPPLWQRVMAETA